MADISVWLDKEGQFVCQRIRGPLTVAEFERVLSLTAGCVAQLDDPEDIRILVDARGMDASNRAVRKLGARAFEEKKVTRMALWGASPMERAVQRFVMVLVGKKRLGTFATEEQARAWLRTGRDAAAAADAGPAATR